MVMSLENRRHCSRGLKLVSATIGRALREAHACGVCDRILRSRTSSHGRDDSLGTNLIPQRFQGKLNWSFRSDNSAFRQYVETITLQARAPRTVVTGILSFKGETPVPFTQSSSPRLTPRLNATTKRSYFLALPGSAILRCCSARTPDGVTVAIAD